jgi:hypothetical protein
MPCTLDIVEPPDLALAIADLPAGTLVERVGTCPEGVQVRVRASHSTYGPAAAPGTLACVPLATLQGTWTADTTCDGVPADSRALPDATRRGIELVKQTYERLFGPLPPTGVGYTDWGYVSLPLTRMAQADIDASIARERLVTSLQIGKGVQWLGPLDQGAPIYAHFDGEDAVGSDFWGRPETVVAVLEIAAAWWKECTTTLAADPAMTATPDTCLLQLADIAYYNGIRPDPLGHVDHWDGRCVDVRLFRTDGSHYEAFWNQPDDREGF